MEKRTITFSHQRIIHFGFSHHYILYATKHVTISAHTGTVLNLYMNKSYFPTGHLFSIFLSPHHLFPVSPMNKGFPSKEQQFHP